MKKVTKAATKKVIANIVNHIADGSDLNEVIANQEDITEDTTVVTVNKEAIAEAIKPTEMIGVAPGNEDAAASFKTEEKVPKIAIVCNINGVNVSDTCRIECAPNPKRPGSKAHDRYAAYAESTTVKEYLDNGGLKADLRYDQNKGYLKVLDAVREGKIIELEVK